MRPWVLAGAALVVLVAAGVAWLAYDRGTEAASGYTPISDFSDLHGIAVSPADSRHLFIATHRGLVRAVDDGNWARVGGSRDDFMGFTVHPRNASIFWSSGHPEFPTAGNTNVGMRMSRDGGMTWTRVALEGVDLHAIAASPADPDNLWAASGSRVWRSTDGGLAWTQLAASGPGVGAFAAHPTQPETVFAATQQGVLRSSDGGRNWTAFAPVANSIAIDPTNASIVYLGAQGAIRKSTDAGATWTTLAFPGGSADSLAIDPKDPRVVYVGTLRAGVYKSTDGAATWTTVKAGK